LRTILKKKKHKTKKILTPFGKIIAGLKKKKKKKKLGLQFLLSKYGTQIGGHFSTE